MDKYFSIQGSPALIFSAHMDTAPYAPEAWAYDPLGGVVSGGRMYGRGTADMKSGLAAMVAEDLQTLEYPEVQG